MRLCALMLAVLCVGMAPQTLYAQTETHAEILDNLTTPAMAPAPLPPSPEGAMGSRAALMNIARQFVARVGRKFEEVDASLGIAPKPRALMLPEGESLFFTLMLPRDVAVESIVTAEVRNNRILLSLGDFVTALELPITVDGAKGVAEGWYIRENKTFELDLAGRTVKTDHGSFALSPAVIAQGDDILAPSDEIAKWFGFAVTEHISGLQIDVASGPGQRLPVEERLARADRKPASRANPKPQFPLLVEDTPKNIAFPFVDVTTASSYVKNGADGKTAVNNNASVTTHGDIAGGTLVTQSQLNQEDKLASLRATYRRDSPQPDLLGPLRAHTYEIGDLTPPILPLDSRVRSGSGMRVSNIDPARVFFNPSTGLTGNGTPGWDVELYRDSQMLDRQTIGPDGQYAFNDVDLYRSKNNFRLVFYGPQGQIREEAVAIPVDPRRRSDDKGVYDVAVTVDGTQLYRKDDAPDNAGNPRLTAIYEKAFGNDSAYQLGLESGVNGDGRRNTAFTGISTVMGPALLNLNTGMQDDGEAGAELVVRTDIGAHQLRNETKIATERFNINTDAGDRPSFENELTLYGPFPVGFARNPRYNLGVEYAMQAQDIQETRTFGGLSWNWGRLSFNQRLDYLTRSDGTREFDSFSTVRGSIFDTRIRADADYEFLPEKRLSEVALNFQRDITDTVDMQLDFSRDAIERIDTAMLQANWRSGHGIISPSIAHNSNGDTIAMLNTTFGIARDPQTKTFRISDEQAGTNGSVAVFVFLDKNGDNKFEGDDEPIDNATIQMVQNGGDAVTDKSGYAFFSRLQNFRQTDVTILPETLEDPYWLPAIRGVSILPREGHLTQLNFPVHAGGEIEGRVYGQGGKDGENMPLRGVSLGLYDHGGNKVMGIISESDGYYFMAPVPPGDYFLMVDNQKMRSDRWSRPDPKPVHIGYDGTRVLANDIYLAPGADVPVQVLAGLKDVQAADPGLEPKALDDKTVVLNLGSYHSRVLMGLMWFKIGKMAGGAVEGLSPLVAPAESYAAPRTGEHTLRISAASLTLEDAAKRCREIVAAGVSCTVEVLPGGLKVASAAK